MGSWPWASTCVLGSDPKKHLAGLTWSGCWCWCFDRETRRAPTPAARRTRWGGGAQPRPLQPCMPPRPGSVGRAPSGLPGASPLSTRSPFLRVAAVALGSKASFLRTLRVHLLGSSGRAGERGPAGRGSLERPFACGSLSPQEPLR